LQKGRFRLDIQEKKKKKESEAVGSTIIKVATAKQL